MKIDDWMKSIVSALLAVLFSGCTSTSFSRYQGQQAAWPMAQGSFVKTTKRGVDIIQGLPNKPYEVVGFVEGSGSGRWGKNIPKAVAKLAQKNGANAIVILRSERELAGFFTTVNMHFSDGFATGSGYSAPVYQRQIEAIAIRYIEKYPKPLGFVDGKEILKE